MSTFDYTLMDSNAFDKMMNGTGINYTSMYHQATNPDYTGSTPYWNPVTQKYMSESEFFQGFDNIDEYYKGMEEIAETLEGLKEQKSSSSGNVMQYADTSAPRVSMPTASPRPFSQIQLSNVNKNETGMGLLNSPLLNKGLLT